MSDQKFSGTEVLVELARLITTYGVDQVEFQCDDWNHSDWVPSATFFEYALYNKVICFRVKPATCTLEGYPRAESVAPAVGTKYWVPWANGETLQCTWANDLADLKFLVAGSVYLDEQDAHTVIKLRKTAVKS